MSRNEEFKLKGLDPETLILDFLQNASIDGSLRFHAARIPIDDSPDVHIQEGGQICFSALSQGASPEETRLRIPHPVRLSGFSAFKAFWGFDLSRLSVNDEGEAVIEGFCHPFHKALNEIIQKSPLAPLFPDGKIKPVKIKDAFELDLDSQGNQDPQTKVLLDSLDEILFKVQSPAQTEDVCRVPDKSFELRADANLLLDALKSGDFLSAAKAVSEAKVYWKNLTLAPQSFGDFKTGATRAHLGADYRKQILTLHLTDLTTTLLLPRGFSAHLSGDLKLTAQLLGEEIRLTLNPENLRILLRDDLSRRDLLGAQISGSLVINLNTATREPQIYKADLKVSGMELPDVDLGLEVEGTPVLVRQLKALGELQLHYEIGSKARVSYALMSSVKGALNPRTSQAHPFHVSAQINGSLLFDALSRKIASAVADFNELNVSFADSESTDSIHGYFHVDYDAATPFSPLHMNWDLKGRANFRDLVPLDLNLDLSQLSGDMVFDIAQGYLIPNLGHSQIQARGDANFPSQNISIRGMELSVKGLNKGEEVNPLNQSAEIRFEATDVLMFNKALSTKIEGLLSLVFDGLNPRGDWDGTLSLDFKGSEAPLKLTLPTTAVFDAQEYAVSVRKDRPWRLGTTDILGDFKATLEGHIPRKNSGAERDLWFETFFMETKTPLRVVSKGREVASRVKINGEYRLGDRNKKISLSGLLARQIPFSASLKPSRKEGEASLSWQARLPDMLLGNEAIRDIRAQGLAGFHLTQFIGAPKAWTQTNLRARLEGEAKGDLSARINGSLAFNPGDQSLSLHLIGKGKNASGLRLGPLQIETPLKPVFEASGNLKGSVRYKNGALSVSGFGMNEGHLKRHSAQGLVPVLSEASLGADSAWGPINGAIRCGGLQGCYAKAKVHLNDSEHLDVDRGEDYSVRIFEDRIFVSKKSFQRWLQSRLKDIKKWEGDETP